MSFRGGPHPWAARQRMALQPAGSTAPPLRHAERGNMAQGAAEDAVVNACAVRT